MTQLERFRALYDEVQVPYIMNPYGDDQENGVITMRIGNDYNVVTDKIDGYTDMYTLIVFSQEGEFIKQGFWE